MWLPVVHAVAGVDGDDLTGDGFRLQRLAHVDRLLKRDPLVLFAVNHQEGQERGLRESNGRGLDEGLDVADRESASAQEALGDRRVALVVRRERDEVVDAV